MDDIWWAHIKVLFPWRGGEAALDSHDLRKRFQLQPMTCITDH